MRFLFVILLLQAASLSIAMSEEEARERLSAYAQEQGLPLPDSGLQIIKSEEFEGKNFKMANNPLMDSKKLEYIAKVDEMKRKGYANRYSENAAYLLSIKDEKPTVEYDSNPYDTHLKTDLSKITIAFPYIDTVLGKQPGLIGFSPMGSWKKNKGWTGFVVYFNSTASGVCSYSINNMKVSHGGVRLVDKYITYDINKKATNTLVEGNKASGFFYNVAWYDMTYIQKLACATKNFDPTNLLKVMDFAKMIDKNVNVGDGDVNSY